VTSLACDAEGYGELLYHTIKGTAGQVDMLRGLRPRSEWRLPEALQMTEEEKAEVSAPSDIIHDRVALC